jgi:hypothetical protein
MAYFHFSLVVGMIDFVQDRCTHLELVVREVSIHLENGSAAGEASEFMSAKQREKQDCA